MKSEKKIINIFFNVDNGYAKYMAVTIASILKNLNIEYLPNFYVLERDISDANKTKINKLKQIMDFEIEYIKIDPKLVAGCPVFVHSKGGESNYRLLLAKVKPEIKKAIYLDVDLVVNDDLSKLWEIDMHDYALLAAKDINSEVETMQFFKKINLDTTKYFNSGVLLVNLDKWRDGNWEQAINTVCKDYAGKLKCPDQDILFIVSYNQVDILPDEWNYQVFKEAFYVKKIDNPKIIHYVATFKPWYYPANNYSAYFWNYAKLTPFFDEILQQVKVVRKDSPAYLKAINDVKKYSFRLKIPFLKSKRYFNKIRIAQALIDSSDWYERWKDLN